MSEINEKILMHLFELAHINYEKSKTNKSKLLKDLKSTIDFFNHLQEIDTSNINPMAGGTFSFNVFRKDNEILEGDNYNKKSDDEIKMIRDNFPDSQNNYLKVPPVFK